MSNKWNITDFVYWYSIVEIAYCSERSQSCHIKLYRPSVWKLCLNLNSNVPRDLRMIKSLDARLPWYWNKIHILKAKPRGQSHWPVYAMQLSIDSLFCIGLSLNATLVQINPLFCFFDHNFQAKSSNFENFENRRGTFKRNVEIAWFFFFFFFFFCAFHTQLPTRFGSVTQWPFFARIDTDGPLFSCIGIGAHCHFCMWLSPSGKNIRTLG